MLRNFPIVYLLFLFEVSNEKMKESVNACNIAKNSGFEKAQKFYQYALNICPNDPFVLAKYGKFMQRRGNNALAANKLFCKVSSDIWKILLFLKMPPQWRRMTIHIGRHLHSISQFVPSIIIASTYLHIWTSFSSHIPLVLYWFETLIISFLFCSFVRYHSIPYRWRG